MASINPEEEKKECQPAGPGGVSSKNRAPPKSVAEIAQLLEDCVVDAKNHNIDFLNFLCD